MNKKQLFDNLKYLTFGLVLATGLSLVHAQLAAPTGSAPSNNIDAPIHTGPNQVKDGGLSVNTFLANSNAQFKQQTFLNGTVFAGSPTAPGSTVSIGDSNAPANISVNNGGLSAVSYIQSDSVANTSSLGLCATTKGTIVTCGPAVVAAVPPSLTQKGETGTPGGTTIQLFEVGPSVVAGDTYTVGVYSHEVTVTAAAGDGPEEIVNKLVAAVNATTTAQWNSAHAAPAAGTVGFPPRANWNQTNSSWIILTLNYQNEFGASASSPQ